MGDPHASVTSFARLAASLAPPNAMCGIAVTRGADAPVVRIATAPGLTASARTLFRVASVSKIVVGRTFAAVAGAAGKSPPYDVDIGPLLGLPLRNPAWPDRPLTLGQVLGHSAGLTDAAGYLVPPGQSLADWLAGRGDAIFLPDPPGTRFHYCNLGYLMIAAAAEALGGDRFDSLARRHVLDPLGIEGGFNWSGVAPARRADRIACYRRDGDALIPQIDAVVATDGVSGPRGEDAVPGPYRPGTDVARLSPQGGLRMSLAGMLTLARSLKEADPPPIWTPDRGTGDLVDGLFHSYGAGLQILPDPPFYPRPLTGHFGNAYGITCGVWYDRQADIAFAYVLNGALVGDEDDALGPDELAIFDEVAAMAVRPCHSLRRNNSPRRVRTLRQDRKPKDHA